MNIITDISPYHDSTSSTQAYTNSVCKLHLWIHGIIFIFAICLMFVGSTDSPFRIEYPRGDSAWFFTAGKSLMAGLTPYADFADSKGPLLWLIYGMGYLICPSNHYGVFLIETLFYYGTFYFLFKTAYLFLNDLNKSLLVSFLMAIFFFQPWIYSEIRAEDFCHLFNATSLFSLTAIMMKPYYSGHHKLNSYFFLLGSSFGGCIMIKYNMAIILVLPFLLALIYSFRKTNFKASIFFCLFYLYGIASIVIPFIIFFLIKNCFFNFINEYFINTFSTISNQHPFSIDLSIHNWPFNLVKKLLKFENPTNLAIKISFISLCFIFGRLFRNNWYKVSILVWYTGALLIDSYLSFAYYLNNLAIFCFFICLYFVKTFPKPDKHKIIIICSVMVFIINFYMTMLPIGKFHNVRGANLEANHKQNIDNIISSYLIMHPEKRTATVLYLECHDTGLGTHMKLLPSSKYWAYQSGMTQEMRNMHLNSIYVNKPDFIVVSAQNPMLDRLLKNYEKRYNFYPQGADYDDDRELFYFMTKLQSL